MTDQTAWNETLVDRKVTYQIEVNGQLVVIENVPARVNVETGENHFSQETVARLQKITRERRSPVRTIQIPVYVFA
ncbi:MAG: hypothetical protein OXO51_02510 [Gemmatimonadota bacterium]|nr:hypothetical protein [Gemmatimonadota bacterium]